MPRGAPLLHYRRASAASASGVMAITSLLWRRDYAGAAWKGM
jgi:hypothetical protein